MRADELLILNYAGFSNHVRTLHRMLERSPSLQEMFVREPARVLASVVFPGYQQPTPATLDYTNRVLFALLSNGRFVRWANQFQKQVEKEAKQAFESVEDPGERLKALSAVMDRPKLYGQIAEALPKFMDTELATSMLIRAPGVGYPDPGGGAGDPDYCPDPPETGIEGTDWCVKIGPPNPVISGNPIGGTRVEIETYIYAVAVAAVFVVVTMIDATPKPAPAGLSRSDLRNVAGQLAGRVKQQADQLRESGALSEPLPSLIAQRTRGETEQK